MASGCASAAVTAKCFAPIRINPAVKPGELFATFHTRDVFLNRLTGPGRDNVVHTPEYKVVAVRIEKLSAVTR